MDPILKHGDELGVWQVIGPPSVQKLELGDGFRLRLKAALPHLPCSETLAPSSRLYLQGVHEWKLGDLEVFDLIEN